MDSSAPTILPHRVRDHRKTPSTLLSFTVKFVLYTALYLSCEKNENKQKEARFGPFFKKNLVILAVYLSQTSFMRMTNRTTQTTTTATVDTTWKNVFRQKNLRRIFFDFFTVMTAVESFKILEEASQ